MILCADDFGLRDDIDRAILELCRAGRLTAVSCMVGLERCSAVLVAELLWHAERADIGLHLCLTNEGLPLAPRLARQLGPGGFPEFGLLLRRSFLHRISPREIARQISIQYALFLEKSGRPPSFIDGHLHAHQMPGVCEGLLEFLNSLPRHHLPYVRNTRMDLRELAARRLLSPKSLLLGLWGARMRRRLRASGIPTNEEFAGIYNFAAWRHYPGYFPRFVASLHARNGVLVVHPGTTDAWRQQEYKVLREFAFSPGILNRFAS